MITNLLNKTNLLEKAADIKNKYDEIKADLTKGKSCFELADKIVVLNNDFQEFEKVLSSKDYSFTPMSVESKTFLQENLPASAKPKVTFFDNFDIGLHNGTQVIAFVRGLNESFRELTKGSSIKQLQVILNEIPTTLAEITVSYCF